MKLYPEAEGTFSFCDRNNTVLDDSFIDDLGIAFAKLYRKTLSFTDKQ